MPEVRLVLQPVYDDMSRADYEAWLDVVRARRLVAAQEYAHGKQMDLDHEADVAQRHLLKQLDMLNKDLLQMEKLDLRVQERMVKIETLSQEVGFAVDARDRGLTNAKR